MNSLPHLEYQFTDPNLLDLALTHRSFLNESPAAKQSNERLEFLGDAILETIISEYLYTTRRSDPEGILTAARAAIVRTETLAQVAQNLNLGDHLKMSRGEERSGGRSNISLLANTTESLLGAIYLDGGLPAAQNFVTMHLLPLAQDIIKKSEFKDAKSLLQEKVQELGLPSPVYKTLKEEGPDHHKVFTVGVFVSDKKLASGKGKNKQSAHQAAAQKALTLYSTKLAPSSKK